MKYLILLLSAFGTLSIDAQDIDRILESEPFAFGGSISGKIGGASASGIDQRTAPFFYGVNTRLNFSFYSFQVPVYFSLRNNSLRYGSNLPRIKISPTYKWASMQIGDVYTRFNPYVLDNRNMRGVALKLTPGKLRFQAIYGKMKDLTSFRDTLQLGVSEVDSYSRKIAGIGLGLGTNRSFVDLYALRAWDDQKEVFYSDRNSTQKSNTVLGLSTRVHLFRRLSIQTNIGLSALTQNINAPGDTQNLYENTITGSLVDLNATSNVNLGGDISLGYRYKNMGLSLRTRYIQPHYQPLSVAYINTDLLDYTLSSNIGLWSNKLYLNGSLGIQKNNLSRQDAITNRRVIYSVNATGRISKTLTANAVISNFSNQLQASSITINELYTYSVTNSSNNLSLRYKKATEDGLMSSVSVGRSNFTVVAEQSEQNNTYGSQFVRINLGYNWESIDADVRMGIGLNIYDKTNLSTKTYTTSLSANKQVLNEHLDLGIDSRYTLIDLEAYREGTNWLNQINATYKVSEKSAIVLYLAHLNRSSYIRPTFSEIRSTITYRLSF